MIVSIARELGAGGRTVGEAIAAALGAPLLDERVFIDELSQRSGLTPDFVEQHIERAPNAAERLISDLAAASAMLPIPITYPQPAELIVETVREIVLEHAAKGDVVVIGHGGVSLLGWRPAGIPVLAILLRAGRAWRIDQLARRYGIERDEARARIERTDEARVRFQKHYFDSDLYDSRQYDVVLNTESLGLDLAIAIATSAAEALGGKR
ncbi:MAG TPA: cytidylate kinase-like family protein [Candidatus Elarobacter sp.]|jgi:cytidylate kinase|nr:cytidylate kinase-like family protein [Candidatus Elarobacter sp.]